MTRGIIATLALCLGMLSSAWGYRVLEQLEDAYELQLAAVTLPDGVDGSVVFTPCSSCRTMSLRVTERTLYEIGESLSDLATVRARADEIRATANGPQNAAVYLYVDVASQRVNRLALSP